MKKKIKSKKNMKIGLVHGVFDAIHIGHLWYFKRAKKLVDKLIVSVTTDKYVNKGPGKPIFDTAKRVELLKSIDVIDEVIISDNKTAIEIIKKIKPDFYIKGSDYKNLASDLSNQIRIEKKAVESIGGKLIFTSSPLFSSSSIINKNFDFLKENAKKFLTLYERNKQQLDKKFKSFIKIKSSKKIILIGDPLLDIIKFVLPSGKSNKNNIIATRFIKEEINLGGTLLVLNFIAQFYKSVEFLFVGNNQEFNFLKNKINKNVKIKFILSDNKIIRKNRYIDNYNNNKFFQVNENEDVRFSKKIQAQIFNYVKEKFNKVDKILFYDFGYNYSYPELGSLLKKFSNKLILNCQTNSYNFGFNLASKYEQSEILGIDENELRLLVQDKDSALEKIIKDNKKLFKKIKTLIVTQGKIGCYILNNNKISFIPTMLKPNIDTTGSGDIFLSMFSILSLSNKFNVDEISIISHVAAGLHANELGNRFNLNKEYISKVLSSVLK